ncbi:uncharacterized protein BXZ73DRAFT_103956 [Epithele typhae]|uniref:uncharacterized protein n=1 Tax=Epithele typhae TaxID=378194 RepID=UPI002007D9FD|nr:uncharacterized protein BXZ73DRAFT_103956 [Epithele typhae]KAH9923158.1 hypothetical protein BXZ73DRAFT_103956 [Epithele typhae]
MSNVVDLLGLVLTQPLDLVLAHLLGFDPAHLLRLAFADEAQVQPDPAPTTPAAPAAPAAAPPPAAAPSQSSAVPAAEDPVLRFCADAGLSADLAVRLRELGINDDKTMRVLGRSCQDPGKKDEMKRDLKEAGFDWAQRWIIVEGLMKRAE